MKKPTSKRAKIFMSVWSVLTLCVVCFSTTAFATGGDPITVVNNISDYEDAVMIEAAARAEIDCIVTRNLKDYAGAPMPVYPPAQFVELLYADED